MPRRDYRCEPCKETVELVEPVDAPRVAMCMFCMGPMERLPSAPSFVLKGSGFYVNDYARKPRGVRQPASES